LRILLIFVYIRPHEKTRVLICQPKPLRKGTLKNTIFVNGALE